ncbi:hypothetical protein ALT785_840006 [Alteromonas infernus]
MLNAPPIRIMDTLSDERGLPQSSEMSVQESNALIHSKLSPNGGFTHKFATALVGRYGFRILIKAPLVRGFLLY